MAFVDYENAIHFGEDGDFESENEKSLGTIYITGGGFVNRPFVGTGTDSKYGWQELVWKKTPTRGANFAFQNLDSTDVGLVARCEVNFKYMNIKDYMDLRKIVGREKRFTVRFFDIDEGRWVSRDMYCSENQYSKLFTLNQSLIGNMDVTIKFVGTNLDLESIIDENYNESSGVYYYNIKYMNGETAEYQITAEYGGNITTSTDPNNLFASDSGSLQYWVTRVGDVASGAITGKYLPDQSVTVWKNLVFFPLYTQV